MVVALAALAAAGAALAAAVPSLLLFFAGSLSADIVDLCSSRPCSLCGGKWILVGGGKRVKKLCEVWRQFFVCTTDDPVTSCDQILSEPEIGLFARDRVICKLCK